ncbi:MAG: alpha/beta fold hydrolase [Burkholderiales bacterium]|nr:alpha/beta fold hydrolase [Burkholderiales bacterium]
MCARSSACPHEARRSQIERAGSDYRGLVSESVAKWVHPTRLHDADVGQVARDMALQAGPRIFAQQQRAIMSRADSRPLLASIRCPAIVVAGNDDALMPREIREELAGSIEGGRLLVLETCGHLVPLEQPAAVADAFVDWLAGVA